MIEEIRMITTNANLGTVKYKNTKELIFTDMRLRKYILIFAKSIQPAAVNTKG